MDNLSVPKNFNPGISAYNYFVRRELLKSITEFAPQLGGRLMDFGCGAKPYQSLFCVAEYIGVDYAGDGHPHTDENIDVYYDGRQLPFKNGTFDSVFSSEVFEHVFNLEEMIKELNRVLKTNGRILITCPFAICEHEVPVDFARYSSFGLKNLLERNGFTIIEQRKTGHAVITVFQLWLTYIHQHISPVLKHIPVVRSAFRLVTYTSVNLMAKLCSAVFPRRNDLYLNNVVLAEKTEELK